MLTGTKKRTAIAGKTISKNSTTSWPSNRQTGSVLRQKAIDKKHHPQGNGAPKKQTAAGASTKTAFAEAALAFDPEHHLAT